MVLSTQHLGSSCANSTLSIMSIGRTLTTSTCAQLTRPSLLCTRHQQHYSLASALQSDLRRRCSLYRRNSTRRQLVRPCARRSTEPVVKTRSAEAEVNLRSEAEAPFRSLRIVFYSFNALSATVAFVIALTQLAAALGHAPNALPRDEVLQGIGIDVAAIAIFSWLLRGDLKARDKQIARMTREERLGQLQVELANKKVMRLTQLRGFSRVVVIAGTPDQVAESLTSAEPYKEDLEKRGVLVVPLPCFDDGKSSQASPSITVDKQDLRWRAIALRQNEWKEWFQEQMALANAKPEKGLYLGLRLDGRVRASGTGPPPWPRFVAELAPVEGMWKGLGDGFDGRVL